jgi:hypothetical protein
MKNAILIILACLTLSGCAAAWGSAYKVRFESSSSVTISYDPSLTTLGTLQNVAQQHCDKYHKDAAPQATSMNAWGLVDASFACKKRER